jgi:tryptophan 2,3-dioxygenase
LGFSPHHFPELSKVAESFDNELLKNNVYLMPTPGRHKCNGIDMQADDLRQWSKGIERAASALLVTVPFFDVLATMTPGQFLEFRGRLSPASGFGSTQFREIEITLGLRELITPRIKPSHGTDKADPDEPRLPRPMLRPTSKTSPHDAMISFYRNHEPYDWPKLARRFEQPTLRDLVYAILSGNIFAWDDPASVDATFDEFAALNVREALRSYGTARYVDEVLITDQITGLGRFLSHREAIVAALLEMKDPDTLNEQQFAVRTFVAACLNLDAALLRWRDQHIRFVESIIGRRPGTGGSGVNYLRTTTDAALAAYFTHVFPCLWQAKSIIQPRKQPA